MSRRDRDEDRRRYRQAKADELRDAGEGDLADELLAGRCACGCKGRIPAGNVRTFFVDERHRKAHHRRRLERLAQAAGVPARLSVQSLRATNGSGDRPADAPAPARHRESKPRPGVSVYFPTTDALEVAIAALEVRRQALEASAFPSYLERLDEGLEASRTALERRRRKPPHSPR